MLLTGEMVLVHASISNRLAPYFLPLFFGFGAACAFGVPLLAFAGFEHFLPAIGSFSTHMFRDYSGSDTLSDKPQISLSSRSSRCAFSNSNARAVSIALAFSMNMRPS